MGIDSLEEKLDSLLKKIDALEIENKKQQHEIERLHDINKIQNLMSNVSYLFEVGMHEERMKYIAKKTPGVTVEWGARGVFEGYENARKTIVDHEMNFERMHAEGMRKTYPDLDMSNPRTGMIESWLVGTPMIEVAGDGKTAKGVWVALMAVAKTREEGGPPHGGGVWWKAGIDFVKEDGEWKIWHYTMNPLLGGVLPDWAGMALTMPPIAPPGSPWKNPHQGNQAWPSPDKPVTEMYNPYRKTFIPKLLPKLPESYETFEETFSY